MADAIDLTVPGELDGERVDKAIAALLDISRSDARRLFEDPVTVDGESVPPSFRVTEGQVVVTRPPVALPGLQPERLEFDVLYEDEHLLVVDKPAGVVVHPGQGTSAGTLAAGLIDRYPELVGVGDVDRWGLVHRLDKGTSGALLVARDQGTFDELRRELSEHRIRRSYTALVSGLFGAPTGTIEAPIGPDPDRPTRRAVIPTGKHARTHYTVTKEYPDAQVSLVQVELETGRTHQIRVHFAAIGHPVVGDVTYAKGRHGIAAPRPFLHSSLIRFTHPETGQAVEVVSPLPHDLEEVLDGLE